MLEYGFVNSSNDLNTCLSYKGFLQLLQDYQHMCSVAQSCLTLWDPLDCSPPSPYVHRISQARILQWVAISCSRGSCWPRDQNLIACIARGFFITEPSGKPVTGLIWVKLTNFHFMKIYNPETLHILKWRLIKPYFFLPYLPLSQVPIILNLRDDNPKGDQSWVFTGRTDVEAETPILWAPDEKSWLIWKDPDAGKDWGQEEKGTAEDEMVGWHHRLNGHGFGWTLGVGDGQGGLVYCGSWGRKGSDMTEQLNWTEWFIGFNRKIFFTLLIWTLNLRCLLF